MATEFKKKDLTDREFNKFVETTNGDCAVRVQVVGANFELNGDLLVQLDHSGSDPDSVQIGDGTDLLAINPDGSINVNTGGATGTPHFAQTQTVTTPSTEQTLISETVPALTTRTLTKVIVTCRQRIKYTVLVDGTVVGSGRCGAGQYSDSFEWTPGRDVATGLSIQVKAKQDSGPATDIEAYLMATDE